MRVIVFQFVCIKNIKCQTEAFSLHRKQEEVLNLANIIIKFALIISKNTE